MTKSVTPILLRYGGSKKSNFEMTEAELKKTAESILQRAKEKSFSKGVPIYFSKEERVFAEYADGQIQEITKRA
jgi:hypothetical protein